MERRVTWTAWRDIPSWAPIFARDQPLARNSVTWRRLSMFGFRPLTMERPLVHSEFSPGMSWAGPLSAARRPEFMPFHEKQNAYCSTVAEAVDRSNSRYVPTLMLYSQEGNRKLMWRRERRSFLQPTAGTTEPSGKGSEQ